ncbi:MAG: protein kinase domain-containing protein, partial [Pseudonocardiaceae bacterium]
MPPAVPGYVVAQRLGHGGSSEVWAARCEATGEEVALKRLRVGSDPAAREELRAEAALLASFTHPNILGLRGVRGDETGLVLILDRAVGSLGDLIRARGRLGAGQAVAIAAAIADALGAAHRRGIVHADVSASNVLLRADGTPLLADLGTARLIRVSSGTARSPIARAK